MERKVGSSAPPQNQNIGAAEGDQVRRIFDVDDLAKGLALAEIMDADGVHSRNFAAGFARRRTGETNGRNLLPNVAVEPPRCYCNGELYARRLMSRTEATRGAYFYKSNVCQFYILEDEHIRNLR